MSNEEIIEKLERGECITTEMHDYISKTYKRVDVNASGKWFTVCRPGNDLKYGRYMIDPYKQEQRNQTFGEFYGSGIVD